MKQIIIACDLHGVLLHVDYKKILRIVWKIPYKIHLFLMSPFILWSFYKIWQQTHVAEEILKHLEYKYPFLSDIHPLRAYVNVLTIDKHIVALLYKLKERNYTLILVSNIGPVLYQDFERNFPHYAALFSDRFIANHKKDGKTIEKNTVLFYELLQKRYKDSTLLLIDDKFINIILAEKVGILGIIFISAYQVTLDLENRDIL